MNNWDLIAALTVKEMMQSKKAVCTCKLLDGREVVYDLCGSNIDAYDNYANDFIGRYEYIGQGRIHSVNSIEQGFTEIKHFWKAKTQF